MKKSLYIIIFFLIFIFATSIIKANQISLISNDVNIQADVKIETNDEFIYQGKITEDHVSSFEVMQENVAIPMDLLDNLEGKGLIKVGNSIRVEGIIKNRIRIAQKVKLISLNKTQKNTDNSNRVTNIIKEFLSNLQN